MKSAFGIDHGPDEISKLGGFGLMSRIAGAGERMAGKGSQLQRSGAQQMNMGRKIMSGKMTPQGTRIASLGGKAPMVSRQNQMAGKGRLAGGRMRALTGTGMKKVGGFMQRSPGGAAAVAGGTLGGAGLGAAAAHTPSNQKLRQFR